MRSFNVGNCLELVDVSLGFVPEVHGPRAWWNLPGSN